MSKWLARLSDEVGQAFDCGVHHSSTTGEISFIGVESDLHMASNEFDHISRTVRKYCSTYMKLNVSSDLPKRHCENMRESYYLGFVRTLGKRLRSLNLEGIDPARKDILHARSLSIAKVLKDMGPQNVKYLRKSRVKVSAYYAGKAEGNKASITQRPCN